MKITKLINKFFDSKIIIHSTLIQRALMGGHKKFDEFSDSPEGKELITRVEYQCKYINERKILELVCAKGHSLETMSEDESIRHELFCLESGSAAEEFIKRADRFGMYPIVTSAQNKDIKLFKTLYDLGADPYDKNDDGSVAVQSKDPFFDSLLKRLIEEGSECSTKLEYLGNNPLQVRITQYDPSENNEGLKEIIKIIHHDRKQLTQKNKDGQTVLILAAEKGHLDLVKVCVKLGASLEETDKNGETALYKALANQHISTVNYLSSFF